MDILSIPPATEFSDLIISTISSAEVIKSAEKVGYVGFVKLLRGQTVGGGILCSRFSPINAKKSLNPAAISSFS